MKKIKKVVIPVAGYGTRFLPFTKSIPKEMLPIVDRPVIQYIVEEAVEAGIEEVILITGYAKRAIEDYFDYNIELEYLLEKSGKEEQRKMIRDVSDIAQFVYIRQKNSAEIGHAVLQAKNVVDDEPFAVVYGDDVYKGEPSKLKQMIEVYEKYEAPVLFTMNKSADEDFDRYGYVKTKEKVSDHVHKVEDLIEKPGKENAPSTLASVSGYILTPDIFRFWSNRNRERAGK